MLSEAVIKSCPYNLVRLSFISDKTKSNHPKIN